MIVYQQAVSAAYRQTNVQWKIGSFQTFSFYTVVLFVVSKQKCVRNYVGHVHISESSVII